MEIVNKPGPTHFEIHAETYFQLKQAGYDVRAELKYKVPGIKRGLIPDLSIFKDGKLWMVLEIKSSTHELAGSNQKKRYQRDLGVTCLVIKGMGQARDVCHYIDQVLIAKEKAKLRKASMISTAGV